LVTPFECELFAVFDVPPHAANKAAAAVMVNILNLISSLLSSLKNARRATIRYTFAG
jgi:hypothetical protein